MPYKMKALGVGVLMMSIIGAAALLINALVMLLGTGVFLTLLGVVAALYFCYLFGDLYLITRASKEKVDA